jgi:fatty-acyl-CoA synthase
VTFRSDNIGTWPMLRAVRSGSATALISGSERLTYAQLSERSGRVATALAARGVRRGDRVAVVLRNRLEFLEILFGAARLGAVFVPVNFRLSAPEIEYVLRDSGAAIAIGQSVVEGDARAAAQAAGVPYLSVDGAEAGYVAERDAAEPAEPVAVDPHDPAMILYTSGTTGPPKGAVLSHENILFNVINYLGDWDIRADDVTVVVNPIFHVVLHILAMPLLYQGGTVILAEEFSPEETLRLIADEGVTVMFAIPTAWQMMVDSPAFAEVDLTALRFIGSGGAACPPRLMQLFEDLGVQYRQGYGLTEITSSGAVMEAADQKRKPGSIGRPFFNVESRIVDGEGRTVGAGEQGELELRARSIARSYWNKPEETTEAFTADGWFRTGDVAYADHEGFIFLVDRKKDIIISGGENVASMEVEQTLLTHPDLLEAAVIGVPHERWGETPRAIVTTAAGADVDEAAVIAHCRARIAHYKCPTSVLFLDELPKTANGKIAKAQLRRRYGTGAVAASLRGADAAGDR